MRNEPDHSAQDKKTPTILREVRQALQGQCDSATLDFQKFPNIQNLKLPEITEYCKKVENCKKNIPMSVILPQIPDSISFTAFNKGRLLVNHTGGVLECNLALHRFFNCPIIPGSAVKGIARNAGRFDEDQERFARVFGGAKKGKSDQAGSVAFLMAIPENNNWKIVPDVLTSHHGSDTKNPTPVFFPAVESGATFRFTVAPTARTQDGDLKFAVKCLKAALAENGAGAKTAAGYGWFKIQENA